MRFDEKAIGKRAFTSDHPRKKKKRKMGSLPIFQGRASFPLHKPSQFREKGVAVIMRGAENKGKSWLFLGKKIFQSYSERLQSGKIGATTKKGKTHTSNEVVRRKKEGIWGRKGRIAEKRGRKKQGKSAQLGQEGYPVSTFFGWRVREQKSPFAKFT